MKANTRLFRSMVLTVVVAMLLGPAGLAPALAQESTLVLTIVGGDNQTAYIGTPYAVPLQLTVTDSGAPLSAVEVRFLVIPVDKKASLNPDAFTAFTDASGIASATVTANEYMGAMEVLAMYAGQDAIFHLANTKELMVTVAGGDNQMGVVETAYAQPLQLTVTSMSAPVAGAVVAFDAPRKPGLASLVPDSFTATTDVNGVASVAVTANVYEGPMEVTASFNGETTAFHLTNIVQPPDPNANPFLAASSCQFNEGAGADDPAANGNAKVCQAQTTKVDCEQYWYCWWRDTGFPNALSDQTAMLEIATTKVYTEVGLAVILYRAGRHTSSTPPQPLDGRSIMGPNVVAIVGTSEIVLVGAGGSTSGANYAKIAFQRVSTGFIGKQLKGIVWTSIDAQVTWGVSYWRNWAFDDYYVPLIVSSEHATARDRRDAVDAAKGLRDTFAYGRELTWGVDGFLGMGGYRDYGNMPDHTPLTSGDTFISQPTDIYVNGKQVTLIPTLDEIGGLSVWLPEQKVLIPTDLFGPYLTPIAPLNGRYIPIDHVLQTLEYYRSLGAEKVTWMHGNYVSGAAEVDAALGAQYDALNYIRTQTLKYISYGRKVEDIMMVVQLPADLANCPYCQPWLQDVPSIVRAVYHDYLGWFDGDPASLGNLWSLESARRLVDLVGGENAVLQGARQAVTEHSRLGAQWALQILGQLRLVHPSEEADDLYRQALKMMGFTTKNAPMRNWYLTEQQRILQPPQ